ncbi:GNAT family N-acetyltransferase [Microvirga sp. VF16]|uniref:GNAT family N-acetyltransferase n=1 Tax=Microvirga sp. VF16 TaxID=2807101 RepID=UPI00193D1F24|nr:GNAT family N-acetyltransferase [Microvirga sp. VF16]QRM32608.1 acetyltransferase [Microvirga sp. VF16]
MHVKTRPTTQRSELTSRSGPRATVAGVTVAVPGASGATLSFRLTVEPNLRLERPGAVSSEALFEPLCAAAEALFVAYPRHPSIALAGEGWPEELLRAGIVVRDDTGVPMLRREGFWQQAERWLIEPRPAFPQIPVLSGDRCHPLRPPKPAGTVYARHIPWLDQEFSLRVATLDDDLDALHRWMNDPRVAQVWGEAGDREAHHRYLGGIVADPHMIPLIGAFDGVPFAYFEIYWAKENRLGPHYDAQDHDRGWHVLVGEEAYRGRRWLTAWLPSLMHYLFLDDARTQRIVGEPRCDHRQQLRNLERSGFAYLKTVTFPHKRAALVMLLRERFFGDGLINPAPDEAAA